MSSMLRSSPAAQATAALQVIVLPWVNVESIFVSGIFLSKATWLLRRCLWKLLFFREAIPEQVTDAGGIRNRRNIIADEGFAGLLQTPPST